MSEVKGKRDRAADKTKRRTGAIARDAKTGRITPFEATPEQRQLVQNMSGINCTEEEILNCVPWGRPDGKPISAKTMREHFGPELQRGRALAGMKLKKSAYDLASAGDKTMLIFLLKTKHGFSETVKVEQTGKDGAPLPAAGPVLYLPAKDTPTTEGTPT
jgi:hypothetical protein